MHSQETEHAALKNVFEIRAAVCALSTHVVGDDSLVIFTCFYILFSQNVIKQETG